MTTLETPAIEPASKGPTAPPGGKLDAVIGRIDLLAMLTTLLGLALLGVAGVALALFELAKLLSSLLSDSFDRWLILALGLSMVWVVARWKKLCVF